MADTVYLAPAQTEHTSPFGNFIEMRKCPMFVVTVSTVSTFKLFKKILSMSLPSESVSQPAIWQAGKRSPLPATLEIGFDDLYTTGVGLG